MYVKSKTGFHTMPRDRARALSRRGTRTITELADDYCHTYAPFIQAAVREVGHNYYQWPSGSRGSESQLNVMEDGRHRA
jgi:hypothetical protein